MRKVILGLHFISLSFMAAAQLQDDFGDGNFTGSPSWSGNSGDFTVNASSQLQLNAATAGISYLSTPLGYNSLADLEWRFFVRQNFAGSSANYGRVYLVSDQQDLGDSLEGYYLQFGEALSADAVELFRQDGTNSISVCRASDGQIASAFALGIKVTRDAIGMWTIWIDPTGGTNYIPETSGMEGMYDQTSFFGVQCVYTSGNRSNFFYDDFYVGSIIPDITKPSIINVNVVSSTELEIYFSEPVDIPVSLNLSNYMVDQGIGVAQVAYRDSVDLSLVHLVFSTPFLSAIPMTVNISGVIDFSGNVIDAGANALFIYFPPVSADPHDIVFSEIMFEPNSTSGLPNAEFVELLNRSEVAIPMEGWTISDGSSTASFPASVLLPDQYIVVCASTNTNLFNGMGEVVGLNQFPGLNNDTGDELKLVDSNGRVIDVVNFNDETYHNTDKDGGGWSLERIDADFVCPNQMNWKASENFLGGTPGNTNSVKSQFEDHTPPELIRAFFSDSSHINLITSEPLDSATMDDPTNYYIFREGIFVNHPFSVVKGNTETEIIISSNIPFDSMMYSLRVSGNLRDCPDNSIDSSKSVRFSFPVNADSADIIINELLFHPDAGGSDFIELFNRSNKTIDLNGWRIAEASFDPPNEPFAIQQLTTDHILLFPEDYIVFTKNPSGTQQRYRAANRFALNKTPELPDFNSTNGAVLLFDPSGREMDRFVYSEEMHFPLLINVEGVSLERLNSELTSANESNWHSSAATNDYATPGYINSQQLSLSDSETSFFLNPSVFSPDNDGHHDVIEIRLNFKEPGWEGSVGVFDLEGRSICTIVSQQLAASNFVLVWDGVNSNREKVPIGIYIIHASFFNGNGKVKIFKKACYVASR